MDLTVKEACEYLGMIYQDLIVLVRTGIIPSYRIGKNYMLKKADLDLFKEKNMATIVNL